MVQLKPSSTSSTMGATALLYSRSWVVSGAKTCGGGAGGGGAESGQWVWADSGRADGRLLLLPLRGY